ncbi:MAG: DNA-3-methyladenine glycosylase [Phycisphaeraceae bacterium]
MTSHHPSPLPQKGEGVRLARSFYRRDPVIVARALLGQRLVRVLDGQRLAGIIVEAEAYLGIPDRAAHTHGGRRTPRVASMWRDGGHAYVYFTYGMHHCMNVVAGAEGDPVAVLLRAIEPTEGLEIMRRHRLAAQRDLDLCRGPARLCAALQIDRKLDGLDMTTSNTLYIEQLRQRPLPASQITTTARIGVAYAGEWAKRELRFLVRGNPHASGMQR